MKIKCCGLIICFFGIFLSPVLAVDASRCFVGVPEGQGITSVVADANGNIVVGVSTPSGGELRSFNASDISVQISGAAAFAQGVSSLAIDSSGNIIAAGNDGDGKPAVMHRAIPHVENGTGYPYGYITVTNLSETPMVAASSTGTFFIGLSDYSDPYGTAWCYYRTLSWDRPNGSAAYDDADLRWGMGDTLGAIAATSQGYLLFAEQMGAYSRVGIRDNVGDGITRFGLQSAPIGYDPYTTYSNQGGWFDGTLTAMVVTADDKVVMGFDNGDVQIRPANDLESVSLASVNFGYGVTSLAVTANGYIVVATSDGGKVYVRSSDLSTDISSPVQVGGTVTGLASTGSNVVIGTSQGELFVRNETNLTSGQSVVVTSGGSGSGWNTTSAVAVTADSEFSGRGAINTINGSGISVDGLTHSTGGDTGPWGIMWLSGETLPSPQHPYVSAGTHWIKYSLDKVYPLGEMWIWNGNEEPRYNNGWVGPEGGMRQVRILASVTDDQAGWTDANANPVFEGEIPKATGAPGNPVNLAVDFAGRDAKYILIISTPGPTHNWTEDGWYDADYLSEVRFYLPKMGGDINKDCYVNMYDLKAMADQWLGCTTTGGLGCVQTPESIPSLTIAKAPIGGIAVDGILSDWPANSEWIWLNKLYYGEPSYDVTEAKFSLRWSDTTDKIYLAVVVNDPDHNFSAVPTYTADLIEVYSQGDAAGGTGWGAGGTNHYDVAQQYFVGANGSGGHWAKWADLTTVIGADAGFESAVTVNGNVITYEIGIKQFDNYGGIDQNEPTVITSLEAGILVGFDVVVDTVFDSTKFSMLSENLLTGKSQNAGQFQLYDLVDTLPQTCGNWGYFGGDINEDCRVNFGDFAALALQWLGCNNPADANCL
ncbi:MAG: autotransporter outer membrane beta-barrel domain-containing protein [Sedimentisphaerales bacterium]